MAWRAWIKAVLPVTLGVVSVSCERSVVREPVKLFPPPTPRGDVVATVEATLPVGHQGRKVLAGLKRQGRIVARAEAPCTHNQTTVQLELRAMERDWQLVDDVYELWITIDRDGLESCYPSFGDWYVHVPWELSRANPHKRLVDPAVWRVRTLSRPENLITIHYHRYDQDYDNVGIWTWDAAYERTPQPNEVFEVGRDEYGLIFQIDRGEYGRDGRATSIGLLPRLAGDWNRKDGENRYWKVEHGNEIWLISSRHQVWSAPPDIRPQIVAAYLDSPQDLVVFLSKPVADEEVRPEHVRVITESGDVLQPVRVQLEKTPAGIRSNYLHCTLFDSLAVADIWYRVRVEGFHGETVAVPRKALDDPELFYDETVELGAIYSPTETTFRVFAPTALSVSVVLYDQPTGAVGRAVHPMQRRGKGVWETTVAGDLEGRFYVYRLEGPDLNPEREVVDIYAVNTVHNTQRARITDLSRTNPPDWERLRQGPPVESPTDMVIYEMHVRDMTIAPNSGVTPAYRGKFLGFIEKIPHLKELGITHVQLLPIQDFENDEFSTNYNWGYVTVAFNSPDGWYASNPDDDSRVREFKALVAALHEAGIGVIMDVVYNHTGSSAPFNHLVPRYYYRFHADGSWSNGSGCGNDFRSEAPMARKYIVDSLKYWVSEYGIDGFRFDLMALIDLETMKEVERELRALNPHIVLYGEPWAAGPSAMKGRPTDKHTIRGTRIGAFNDQFRNALIGSPFDEKAGGFMQNGTGKHDVERALEGSWRWWAPRPAQTINYISCHDNYVIIDKLRLSRPDATEADHIEMMKLGYLLLFTAQGVPFIHGGEEFARSKQGHHNSYDAPDAINQVDWSLKEQHRDLFEFTRDLIALRHEHPAFRIRAKEQIAAWMKFHDSGDAATVMFTLAGSLVDGEPWKNICVIANANDSRSVEVSLPVGRWYIALDHTGRLAEPRVVEGAVRVRFKSGLILYQP